MRKNKEIIKQKTKIKLKVFKKIIVSVGGHGEPFNSSQGEPKHMYRFSYSSITNVVGT